MKRWQHLSVYAALLAIFWSALGVWQWHEYGQQCQAARESVVRQAQSIGSALVGGIRSHRRMGPYFEDQLQATVDELVQSEDILAVAIFKGDGARIVSAGKSELLDPNHSSSAGSSWTGAGFRYRTDFHLDAESTGGRGPEGGTGRGRGWWWRSDSEPKGPFSDGGDFAALLLLDQTRVDRQCADAFWLRGLVVVAGGTVLVCVGLAWLATIWLLEARGRTTVLETEARHLRDLSQAAAGLAHETRNPLGLIRGWTQRLAASNLPTAQQRDQVRAVIEECDRVTARINQFLAFVKPAAPNRASVDPSGMVAELARIIEPDLECKRLRFDESRAERSCEISADPEMLRQALFNLIQNAVQFSPYGGTIEIRVFRGPAGGCRVEVADRGPGVPKEKVGLLFSPYFTTRPGGTGLGLAIVRRIAASHGWRAGYAPRSDGGSVFWLEIHD